MTQYIKRGSDCVIPVAITANDAIVDISDIAEAEFMIGPIKKLYPDEVPYGEGLGCFFVPLSQRETMKLQPDSIVQLDLRVKLSGGGIVGLKSKIYFDVVDTLSREVI